MRFQKRIVSLDYFYPTLMEMEEIYDALDYKFGEEEAEEIIKKFQSGIPLFEINESLENFLEEYIDQNSDEIQTYYSEGGFEVSIMNFGPVYWVSALECSPNKYFKSEEDATSFAQSSYEVIV